MDTKLNPDPNACYARALPDEPRFTFLGRDKNAPAVIRQWIAARRDEIANCHRPQSDLPMLDEAEECAAAMEAWREENYGKWWNV